MRIKQLSVHNFRALKSAELSDLPDMVVIAGPNGCGKSSLFDALRLLKSAYGGYQPNEWETWFGEHQISLDQNQPELLNIFRDRNLPVRIRATFGLEQTEIEYLRTNARELLRPLVWDQYAGDAASRPGYGRAVADQIRRWGTTVDGETSERVRRIVEDLERDNFVGDLTIEPNLAITIAPSPTLELLFSFFRPDKIGIMDYHGAQRSYNREQIGGINLSIETDEQQYGQHALYNSSAKYQNIKSRMAAAYVRELLEREAGAPGSQGVSLIDTLKEMFALFFPDKEFLGPVPTTTGKLLFPVRTASGSEHDINELSSGEKEVLYGYLRLQNVSPRNSVLLLDEPELHLNPRLIRGLPQFYHRHLGTALNNQIWLLTHSDALLREAVGQDGYAVFHMQGPSEVQNSADNQMHRVAVTEDLDRALVDLVGDLATYRPGGKVAIFEGGGDSEFDVTMTAALFPEFASTVNLISGTNKGRVRELHALLERAASRGVLRAKFFSIVDRDSDAPDANSPATALVWELYHIENHLLEPEFILKALQEALGSRCPLNSQAAVLEVLKAAAREVVSPMVRSELEAWANEQLVRLIAIGGDPSATAVSESLKESIRGSAVRFSEAAQGFMVGNVLREKENEIRERLESSMNSDEWKSRLRGRSILAQFVRRVGSGLSYDVLRNLIIARMRDVAFQPPAMKRVLDAIVSA